MTGTSLSQARSKTAHRMVGLDLGTSGIRAAELRHNRTTNTYEVARVASVELPHGAVHNGEFVDIKMVTKALKKLWKQGRFSTRKVTFGISDSSVITRQLDLPWMPPADFAQALPYQVNEALPVETSTVEMDYHLLRQLPGKDSQGQEMTLNRVLIVASNRDSVTAEAQLIRKSHLIPLAADSAPFALIRAACQGKVPHDDRMRVIADLGSEQLTVIVHQNGQPRFIRTISNFGGDSATHAIANFLDLSQDAAEELKKSTGLNGPIQEVAAIPESTVFRSIVTPEQEVLDPATQATINLLNPWATTLIKELRDSIDYFVSSTPGTVISDVTLCGRSTHLAGLQERIATELPYPVAMMEPLLGLESSNKVSAHPPTDTTYAVAIGLAMGAQ